MDAINERVKQIRQDLNLSQKSFAEEMGLSRDVISNIEYGRTDVKENVIKSICKFYRVNYFWLTEGKGDPYLGPPDILMDDVVERYSLDEFDRKIVEEYVKLDPDSRSAIKKFIQNVIKEAPDT